MSKHLPPAAKLPPFLFGLVALCASALTTLRCWFSRKETKWFEANLDKIWSLRPKSTFADMFIKQVYHNQIMVAFETILEVFFPGCITFEGINEFEAQMRPLEKEKQGQIMVSAHLGSWELIGYAASRISDCKFYALAKPSKYKAATALLDRMRRKMKILVLWTSGASAQKNMIRALKEGSWLGFIMDQKPMGRRGPKVNFWGRPTEFVGGPAQMAVKFKKPVLAAFCVRVGPLRYRLFTKTVLDVGHDCQDVQQLTQLMAQEIEEAIKTYPEQWCWNYKRWRFDDKMAL
ncbi:MAG: lysophospholipid acyltransferase family protein [Oligoflexales bacterium]|nr:lysophospholipid acyltransferase family protein [Oligoflexales bacterium]